MSRQDAVELAARYFDDGRFLANLARRVAVRTESQHEGCLGELYGYLSQTIIPDLQRLGFDCRVVDNAVAGKGPFLIASRTEPGSPFTVLTYGHGDVVNGHDDKWREGLDPWSLTVEGDRWYGRGTADNKAQHTINLAALEQVLQACGGRLGYDIKVLLEMGEEAGSPGLARLCEEYRTELAADVFIASDGPRLSAQDPTVFLGARGGLNIDFHVRLREGSHHSGNWGGLLRNPGVRLSHAIASLVGPMGQVLLPELLPAELPANVRQALSQVRVGTDEGAPQVDPGWGEPGLTPAERVFGWNTFEVIAFKTGSPEAPINAIPGHAYAQCQIRYVIGSDRQNFIPHIRAHLDRHGFTDVEIAQNGAEAIATRLDPDDAWAQLALSSIEATTGKLPTLLPNLGGSLPNDIFADGLGLPTVWIPHSYPGCRQHAPDEHVLGSVARESLQIMAGLFWDLRERGGEIARARRSSGEAAA